MVGATNASEALRDRFREERERVAALLEQFVAVGARDHEATAELWSVCESALRSQLEGEERSLVPLLKAGARGVLIHEHRYLRSRMSEVARAVERGGLRVELARAFVDEVEAHARSEDRLVDQWIEEERGEQDHAPACGAFVARSEGAPLPGSSADATSKR